LTAPRILGQELQKLKKSTSKIYRNIFLRFVFILPSMCTWLPDGLFSNQKSQFGYILEGLGMENVVFYGHFGYFTAI
jgi:hypothetical protein